MSSLEFHRKLKVSIKEVWSAWTDSETIAKWFSPDAFIEPFKGGSFELYFDPSNHEHMSTIGCKIIEIQPMSHFSFQWRGPDQFLFIMNNPDPATYVRITFSETSDGITISVIHKGWGSGRDWNEAKEWHRRAWVGVLQDLKNYFKKRKEL